MGEVRHAAVQPMDPCADQAELARDLVQWCRYSLPRHAVGGSGAG